MEDKEPELDLSLKRPRRTRREWIETSWFFWLVGVFVIGWSLYQYFSAAPPLRTDFLHGVLIGLVASVVGLGLLLAAKPRTRATMVSLLVAGGVTAGVITGTILVGASAHLRLVAFGAMGAVFVAGYLWSIGYMATHWSTLGWRSTGED